MPEQFRIDGSTVETSAIATSQETPPKPLMPPERLFDFPTNLRGQIALETDPNNETKG